MADVIMRRSAMARSPFVDVLGWDPFRSLFASTNGGHGIEVTRSESGYDVELPVAGYAPEQIEVTLDEHVLTIAGKAEKRQFTRSLLLPEEIAQEQIAARTEHGLLHLTLPFHPKAQPRKIAISSN